MVAQRQSSEAASPTTGTGQPGRPTPTLPTPGVSAPGSPASQGQMLLVLPVACGGVRGSMCTGCIFSK